MSEKHTPGTERLTPVCEASGLSLQAYLNSANKDGDGRAPCPICRKVVKLRMAAGERWANTIPHHHTGRLAGAAFVDAVDAQTIAARRIELAASEMLAVLQWMFPEPGMQRPVTDEMYARARAAIAKATGGSNV